MCPGLERLPKLVEHLYGQLTSRDVKFTMTIMMLLDLWGEELPQIPVSDKVKSHIAVRLVGVTVHKERERADVYALQLTATT